MALYYLVRHGEPDYDAVRWEGFFGFGCSFAPLSELGRRQAAAAAEDERLRGAELIVSSPYTRALETAAIISRRIDRELVVETELHEWEPDWTNNFRTAEEASALAAEFKRYGGEYPEGKTLCWETLSALRARIRRVADKYAGYDKVIFVGHGMIFRALAYIEGLPHAGIVECHYEKGQPDCRYSFY